MAIDADEVLEEVKIYLPSENVFTDNQMLVMIQKVINAVGSDDSYYEEVTCKSTKMIAENNAAKSSLIQSYKGIRTEDMWEEFFKGDNNNVWDNFLSRIKTVCTNIGYTGLPSYSTGYMCVNISDNDSFLDDPPIDVNPTSSTSSNLEYPL
jgi:hypothetical protein